MKVHSIGRQVFRSRAYLYLFCALALGCLVGLRCSSDKRCTGPTAPTLPRLGPTTWLDLDEDGTPDFVFKYWVYVTHDIPSSSMTNFLKVRFVHPGPFPWLDRGSVQYTYLQGPIPLPDSAVIDSALGWSHYGVSLAGIHWWIESGWESRWTGTWAGVSEMSLGLQLVREDSSYFGWAKLSVDAESGLLTVHDYAYNHRAGLPVLAGVHPPAHCPETSCPQPYSLFLRPSGRRFPVGRYDVHVTPEGDTARSCWFIVSDDPGQCATERCVPTENCNAVYMVGYPFMDWAVISYAAIEVPIEVVVVRDGGVVGVGSFEPVFEISYPNGPECPDTCYHTKNVVVVE